MIHPFRLPPNTDLRAGIEAYVNQHGMEAGWILTCVGSLTEYHLRFANQSVGAKGKGHFEIVSLVGTVSVHGCHLHVCLADEKGRTLGGHLLEGCRVYTTAEIVIGESRAHVFRRETDAETGFRELTVDASDV